MKMFKQSKYALLQLLTEYAKIDYFFIKVAIINFRLWLHGYPFRARLQVEWVDKEEEKEKE